MQLPAVFLTLVLILTACKAPVSPDTDLKKVDGSESHGTLLDGTFATSLLAMQWRGGSEGTVLFPVNPSTGATLPDYPPFSLGYSSAHALSPDRSTLAVVSFADETTFNGSLLLIDISTWKTQRFDLELIGGANNIVFSPDGNHLAIAHGESSYKLTMFDLEKGVITSQAKLEPFITQMKFTANGEALMLYCQAIGNHFTEDKGNAGTPRVLLLDAQDLSPRWSASLDGVRDGLYPRDESVTSTDLYEMGNALYLSPGSVFAPSQDVLYILPADAEELITVNYGSRMISAVNIEDQLGWFEQLLALTAGEVHAKVADGTSKQATISPDGQFLYVVGSSHASSQDQNGNWQVEQTPLGLEIIQTRDGRRLEHLESDATELSLSPDGKYLYLRSWDVTTPWTEVFDLSSVRITAHRAGVFAEPALLMNGEFLLASTYSTSESAHHMSILEANDLDVILDWTGEKYIFWLPAR